MKRRVGIRIPILEISLLVEGEKVESVEDGLGVAWSNRKCKIKTFAYVIMLEYKKVLEEVITVK